MVPVDEGGATEETAAEDGTAEMPAGLKEGGAA
jgi:hypothetical protein